MLRAFAVSVVLALVAGVAEASKTSSSSATGGYHIRTSSLAPQGDDSTTSRKLNNEFKMTFSDDGETKVLEPFLLDLYETKGKINANAVHVIRTAMDKFMLAELVSVYPDMIDNVGTEVLSAEPIDIPLGLRTRRGRNLQTMEGTETEMVVQVEFAREPSPKQEELEIITGKIMEDLTNFVSNITVFGNKDLENVVGAYRKSYPTPAPSSAPSSSVGAAGVRGNNPSPVVRSNNGNSSFNTTYTVSSVLVGASLIALAAYFVVRRRRNRDHVKEPSGDMLYVDVENDMYSVDRSVGDGRSPTNDGSVYTNGTSPRNAGDSVFSGLSSQPSTSPTKNMRSSKSIMSGYTQSSRTTVQVSNKMNSPRSAYYGYTMGQDDEIPKMAASDGSDDESNEPPPQSPSDESSNLAGAAIEYEEKDWIAANEGDKPDPTPRVDNKTVAYSGFNCVPARSCKNPESQVITEEPEKDGDDDIDSKSKASRKPGDSPLNSTMDSQMSQRSAKSNGQWETGSSIGVMSGIATKVMEDAYEKDKNNGTLSSTGSRSADDGGSRPTTPRSNSRPPTPDRNNSSWGYQNGSPSKGGLKGGSAYAIKYPGEEGYGENLSRPSTPGDNSTSLNMADYDNEMAYNALPAMLRISKGDSHDDVHKIPTDDLMNDGSAMYQTDSAMDGRRHAGDQLGEDGTSMYQTDAALDTESRSRRHAGDQLGADGSAMYQANAMDPLDWSYKSADVSVEGAYMEESMKNRPYVRRSSAAGGKPTIAPKSPESSTDDDQESTIHSTSIKTDTDTLESTVNSQGLVQDLVWLEKKIADTKKEDGLSSSYRPPTIEQVDSLSYMSDNAQLSPTSSVDSSGMEEESTVFTGRDSSVMSSIVCRDCYAPPGRLNIVIHSTKDGPAVHTVKEESALKGHIFPGDLIISVDNVDTRSYTAEDVMKMMAARSEMERKITVLHFEEDA